MILALVLWYHWSVPPVRYDYSPPQRYWITEEPPLSCELGTCLS